MGIVIALALIGLWLVSKREIRITRTFSLKGFKGKVLVSYIFFSPLVEGWTTGLFPDEILLPFLTKLMVSLVIATVVFMIQESFVKKSTTDSAACSVCNRPGHYWTPMGGAPYSDYLCTKHGILRSMKHPQTYITLFLLLLVMLFGYGVFRLFGNFINCGTLFSSLCL